MIAFDHINLEQTPRLVVSGGQTGVDRAGLDWAINHGIEHGGWCPAGRKAQDGPINAKYTLKETTSEGYRARTRLNIEHSDATLIITTLPIEGGSALTQKLANKLGKPCLVINLADANLEDARNWVRGINPNILNIAGPSEGREPGIYGRAMKLLNNLFTC